MKKSSNIPKTAYFIILVILFLALEILTYFFHLQPIKPLYGRVIKMLHDGLSQRAIAATLGKPNSTAQDLIRKTRLEAQRIVSRKDLYR